MNLEHELQQALRRKTPSPGFDERVVTKIASGHTGQVPSQPSPWARRALPLAASIALIFGGYFALYQDRQERLQTERAVRDVVLALQIASDKVSAVQVKVQEIAQHERQVQ